MAQKRRRLLMRFSLLLYAGVVFGIASAQPSPNSPDAKSVKNVILMIGDGMGIAQISAGMMANNGRLNLEACPYVGFSKTNSSSHYITESAAGATALATGHKTYNGAIGVDKNGMPLPTILEIAKAKGKSTGIVVSSSVTSATPAAFVAHQPSRHMTQEIAFDIFKADVDVFIGGGRSSFEKRDDGQNLIRELKRKDYLVVLDPDEIPQVAHGRLAALIPSGRASGIRGDKMTDWVATAIRILDKNNNGFFLMIEGSQIDVAGHENDSRYLVEEMVDFDRVIGEVLNFARLDGETLVIITADHETGGYTLTGEKKFAGEFSTDDHTSVMVPVFAFGPHAETLMGIYHNNTIFDKMINAFGF